jgi:hypothetical protein
MGIQIALLIGDDGVWRQWLGHLRDGPIIVFERAIREWSQLANGTLVVDPYGAGDRGSGTACSSNSAIGSLDREEEKSG